MGFEVQGLWVLNSWKHGSNCSKGAGLTAFMDSAIENPIYGTHHKSKVMKKLLHVMWS